MRASPKKLTVAAVFSGVVAIFILRQTHPSYFTFNVHALVDAQGVVSFAKSISQDDIYVSIKTCSKYHKSRLPLIFKTWWDGIKDQAYFFTDMADESLSNQAGGHIVVTKCGMTHDKWWCHFDDDNYVNPSMLVDVLKEYDWKKPMYVGRPSREGDQFRYYKKKKMKLRFATGGAGICITRNMSELMAPWMSVHEIESTGLAFQSTDNQYFLLRRNGSFVQTCKDLSQPDDVTFGFVVTNRLQMPLSRRDDFNSHTQDLAQIPMESLLSQVVLSYSFGKKNGHTNIINMTDDYAPFPLKNDRTRMLSYHCLKYPQADWCPGNSDSGLS